MDLPLLISYSRVAFRELWRHKFMALASFMLVSFLILLVGIAWPVKYKTEITIYADNQNILKPLLANQAAVTKVQDQTRVVRDAILSPSILRGTVESIYSTDSFESAAELEQKIKEIRGRLKISSLGGGHIKVSYSDQTADNAYTTLNTVVDSFIKDSSESKREESREAYLFIDRQVKQYKDQLVGAEENLKAFKGGQIEGSVNQVDARISKLRSNIEEMKIDIDEGKIRVASLKQQLSEEKQYTSKRYKADVYRKRLSELEERLGLLLLTYKESYPDVVSLKLQIEDMRSTIREAEFERGGTTGEEVVQNPLYDGIRERLSEARVELMAQQRRLSNTENLLEEEYERRKRIAEGQAQLAELTRDYNVTKKIYEDMLERKEKARLSMTLNVEGQGLSFKVQEPAEYPLTPVGFSFLHFVILGPLLGVMAPLVAAVGYIVLDPRVRFSSDVEEATNVPILAVVPHVNTPFSMRMRRGDMVLMAGLSGGFMVVYLGVVLAYRFGIV